MESSNKITSRKKFFLWSAGALASITALKHFFGNKPEKKESATVKMLTQEGTLIEIDKKLLGNYSKKITNN